MKSIDEFLDEVEIQMKRDLNKFIDGTYRDYFSEEQYFIAIEYSFLLNHLYLDDRDIIFRYDDSTFKFNRSNITELTLFSGSSTKELVINMIKNSDEFKSSFKKFLRDYKINKIIE